jgi:heat shock protein HtpX
MRCFYMAMGKRIFFFLITNIAVIATISIIINVFGLMKYIDKGGINYPTLMIFCVVWGMGGALISLFLSKSMVKWSMGVRIIDSRAATGNEAVIVDMVRRMSTAARIPMPEVGIYDSPEVNAFATGATKKSSLVAVSTGLLENMSRDEVEGVIGHEVSHVANGDMVTMVLIQGVVNAFALFLSRILSYAISMALSKDEDSPVYMIRWILTIVFDIVFSILGSLIVAFFSRIREFGADYGSAKIAGKQKMIGALRALQRMKDAPVDERGAAVASLKIGGKKGFIALFSTHPALEDRIAALEKAKA